ncbi:MAG TPA: ComEA family DNA-binding protein [Marinobacter sp.]|nr:ComEA family DNA-binding protein [Marinobacter sp.]
MKPNAILAALVLLFSLTIGIAHANEGETININTADVATLALLNGIGESKAQAIVKDREENGPFASTEDLARVKGIGAGTVARNADRIAVE